MAGVSLYAKLSPPNVALRSNSIRFSHKNLKPLHLAQERPGIRELHVVVVVAAAAVWPPRDE